MSSFSSRTNPSEPGNGSFFSFTCGQSSGVTQIMNLKIKKFGILIFKPETSSTRKSHKVYLCINNKC